MDEAALPKTCCPPATIWLWPGQAAYLGPSLNLAPHAGSVHCFALGVDAPFTLHTKDLGERRVRSALLPARTRHHLIADGRMLFFYLDPAPDLPALDFTPESLLAQVQAGRPDPARLREFFLPPHRAEPDERIRAALEFLRARPAAQTSAAELAATVHLSTSRFLHLFSATTHTTFRRYRLWTRMLHVATAISNGADLTQASTAAGFASPSHFSDTFRAMFGLSASTLLAATTRLIVLDD